MIKKFVSRYHYILYMGLSFVILDFYIRITNRGLGYISCFDLSPNFFTLAWVLFLISIILILKGRLKKIIYFVALFFFQTMLLTNYIYNQIFGTFFSLKSIGLAGEAQGYFKVIFDYIHPSILIIIAISFALAVIACHFMPKEKTKGDIVLASLFILLFIAFYISARIFLGPASSTNEWDTWTNKRNVYESFSDTKKSLQTSGLFEYVIRDIYLSKVDVLFKNNKEDIAYLDDYFASENDVMQLDDDQTSDLTDEWSGIFKNKNVIVVLMESVDSWIATPEMMPTLSKLMSEGVNFTNHYSPIYGGGATFNSEFMANTGYMTPLNGETASNKYGNNYFPYSLPNLFKDAGYTVNSFHENVSSFYNRGQMSKAFGYENYYSSFELGVPYKEAVKDTHFITNDKIRNLLLPDKKFMSFIITYTLHTPYTTDEVQCANTITNEELAEIKNGASEEDVCVKAQARETDNMFKDLIAELKKENKLDDTIIIGYTDHYAYGYQDREKVTSLIGTDDSNMISKLPFFIWGTNIEDMEVSSVNSNLDILPTIASLFGLDYNPKYYLGRNILDPEYDGFAFFGDYSWYDGDVYYKNNQVVMGDSVDKEYIEKRNKALNTILDINKKVLDTNYFSTLSSNQ